MLFSLFWHCLHSAERGVGSRTSRSVWFKGMCRNKEVVSRQGYPLNYVLVYDTIFRKLANLLVLNIQCFSNLFQCITQRTRDVSRNATFITSSQPGASATQRSETKITIACSYIDKPTKICASRVIFVGRFLSILSCRNPSSPKLRQKYSAWSSKHGKPTSLPLIRAKSQLVETSNRTMIYVSMKSKINEFDQAHHARKR